MDKLSTLFNQGMVTAPGVYDGLSAKLVEQAGFDAVYASGGAIARSTGRPDIGLLTMTEVVQHMRDIVSATNLPVIADADTGFGNELNTARTVEEFQCAGISAMHIEDQTFPKRCGHLKGKSLIASEDMCIKINAAIKARSSTDFLIIARTDAIAIEGFDKAIERAKAYLDSGADMIFIEAPETVDQIKSIAEIIPQPKVINMFYGGKTPLMQSSELSDLGYALVIIPSDLQRAAIKSMQNVLTVIKKEGNSKSIENQLISFDERETLIGTNNYI